MKEWLKIGAMFLFSISIFVGIHLHQEKRKSDYRAKCSLSIECQEKLAKKDSLKSKSPVTANSGKVFFKGVECFIDCSRLEAGYNFAEKVGLTKWEGCKHSNPYIELGCLSYYREHFDNEFDPGSAPDGP